MAPSFVCTPPSNVSCLAAWWNARCRRWRSHSVSRFIKLLPVLLLTATLSIESISLPLLPATAQSQTNQSTEIDRLIQQLKGEDVYGRSSAAPALGKIGIAAIPKLLPLLRDKNADVRSSAARA